jgi:phosphoserine phosphatase RsbU/P
VEPETLTRGGTEWSGVLTDLLKRAKQAVPDQLAEQINMTTRRVGLEVTLYLVDHEQRRLWPVPERGKRTPEPLSVDGTLAGRAFTLVRTQPSEERSSGIRLWVPVIDGAERLGVADMVAHAWSGDLAQLQDACETLAGLVGHLIMVKMPYGDALGQIRRTGPMALASELLLPMLPPLTFSCERFSVSGILEPCYDGGGDAFDYAVDGAMARVMILDAMGRGLPATLTCVTAMAALRSARRNGRDMSAMAGAADRAVTEQFADVRFVTGVLADLNIDTGTLRYLNAGHPRPLLLRRGKAVRQLMGGRRLPLGLGRGDAAVAGEERLEPGDRLLLYTDGVVEAQDENGVLFGLDRLVDLAERGAGAGLPAPETLRRLTHTVLEHQHGPPRDDATLVLLEWSEQAAAATQP